MGTKLAWIVVLAAACSYPHPGRGDAGANDDGGTGDGMMTGDGSTTDAMFPTATARRVMLGGMTVQDGLVAVVAAPGGAFFAGGFAIDHGNNPPTRRVVVVKLTEMGALDTTFGSGGIAVTPLQYSGLPSPDLAITLQQGRILVAATVPSIFDPANDNDIAVASLQPTGLVDTTFGTNGVVTYDISAAAGSTYRDVVRAIGVDSTNRIYVAGMRRSNAMDTDVFVTRLLVDGDRDTAYGSGSVFTFGVTTGVNDNVRAFHLFPNGRVLVGGYGAMTGITRPFVVAVNPDGSRDTAFGANGYVSAQILEAFETYGIALHGPSMLVTGYGRAAAADPFSATAMRLDAVTGAIDTSFAGSPLARVYPLPPMNNRSRDSLALLNSTLIVGNADTATAGVTDGFWALIQPDGTLANTGHQRVTLGGRADILWDVAASATHVMMVGLSGAGGTQSATLNDDAYVAVITLP